MYISYKCISYIYIYTYTHHFSRSFLRDDNMLQYLLVFIAQLDVSTLYGAATYGQPRSPGVPKLEPPEALGPVGATRIAGFGVLGLKGLGFRVWGLGFRV